MKTLMLPEWFSTEIKPDLKRMAKYRNPSGFIRNAVASIGEAVARLISGSDINDSLYSRIEPRARIAAMLILIMGTIIMPDLWKLILLFLVGLLLAFIGNVSFRNLCMVWMGVPLFSLAIILPSLLNVVTPGINMIILCKFHHDFRLLYWSVPDTISITDNGIIVATRILFRVIDSITFSYVLVASSRPEVLINALRRMGIPKIFGMILATMQRYLITILRAAEEIHLAKLSRTIAQCSLKADQEWTAAGIGILFGKVSWLSQEVHNAMISRGFDGDIKVKEPAPLNVYDILWVAVSFSIVASLVFIKI